MDFYVDGDPFDRFPWTVTLYSTEFQDLPEGHRKAFISTANGKRIDNGEQHTYWSVAGDLWEPVAVMIAKAVNAEAHARYGTPNPTSVYADEWRETLWRPTKKRAWRTVSSCLDALNTPTCKENHP